MSTYSDTETDGSCDGLLLESSEILMQIANIARGRESDGKLKIFYSHLASHCLRFRNHIHCSRQHFFKPDKNVIIEALGHLGSLISEDCLQRLEVYTATPESRLQALNFRWGEIQHQQDNERREFITEWTKLDLSDEYRREIDKRLKCCADDLDRQSSKLHPKKATDILMPSRSGNSTKAIWKTAQTVFDALLGCQACPCVDRHDFRAKLGLGAYATTKKVVGGHNIDVSSLNYTHEVHGNPEPQQELRFDMFLSTGIEWGEVRIRADKETIAKSALDATKPFAPGRGDSRRYKKVDHLCESIAKVKPRALQRLVLELTSGHLFEIDIEKSNSRIRKVAEPISLHRCLEERHEFFTEKTKRVLSLILGYMTLQLNGSSWLQPGWSSKSIEFFQTVSHQTPLRPFIQTQLPQTSSLEIDSSIHLRVIHEAINSDNLADLDSRHRCPTLIALAVVLMEIHFVMTFRKLADLRGVPLIEEPAGRITLVDVDQVFNGDDEEDPEGWRSHMPQDSPVLVAIDHCLDTKLWEDHEGLPLDSATLTLRIEELLIKPLEAHLTSGFGRIPLDDIEKYARNIDLGSWGQIMDPEPGSMSAATAASAAATDCLPSFHFTPALVSPVPIKGELCYVRLSDSHMLSHPFGPVLSHPTAGPKGVSDLGTGLDICRFFDDMESGNEDVMMQTRKYLTWRSEYEKVYQKFSTTRGKDILPEPIRIAILDTGIDGDHETFEARRECLKAKHNSYNESHRNVVDRNGHGTFTTSLILDYAPDAELYVIKIADMNMRPDARIVANAINYAVNEWKVDMISMSFGWPSSDFENYDVLEQAIDKAYSKKVLMFAAASNSGGRSGRAYPASSPHVICVHSTDTDGDRSGFSPTAERNTINLATVGQSVQSAWPMLLCEDGEHVKTRSGTSYATPIMVGITAFLLSFARLHLSEKETQGLMRKEKIECLLRRCAERGPNYQPRDGYFYVELSLSRHNLFGQDLEEIRREFLKVLRL